MIYYGGNNLPAKLRSKRRRAAKMKSLRLSGDFNISIAYTRPEKIVLPKSKAIEPKAAKPVGIKPAAVKPIGTPPATVKTEKKVERAKAVKQPKEVKPVSEKPAVKSPEKTEKTATEEVKAVKSEKNSETPKIKAAETEKTAKKEKSPAAAIKKETKETEKPAVKAKTSKTTDKKAEIKPEVEVKSEKEEKTEPAVTEEIKTEEVHSPAVEEPKAEETPAVTEEVKTEEVPSPAVEEPKAEEIPAVTEEVKTEEVPSPAEKHDDGKFKLDPAENADILSKMATKRARKLIYAPKEALYEITGIKIDVEGKKNDKGVKVKDILEAEIKEGLKLGYLDKYDGLKTSEIKEEYENDTVWELAEQEFKKMGMLLDGDKIKVYVYDFTGSGCHHVGYVPEAAAKDIIPYLKDIDKYSFDLCGIITGGKSKTVTKDPKTGKITITKGKDGNYGVDLDVTIIPRKD
ncbi:MAG: hypothetical protein SOX77_03950 [Candidatus Borkfalkiaceae bacterium]|nr:hypothetical protein [Christensenellaceae bacterium]